MLLEEFDTIQKLLKQLSKNVRRLLISIKCYRFVIMKPMISHSDVILKNNKNLRNAICLKYSMYIKVKLQYGRLTIKIKY